MNVEQSDAVELTPTTTRVGSGSSARLVALAVAGVLVSVVGFAFVNRPPPLPPAVAQATATPEPPPTPTPTPTPVRNQIEGNDGIYGWPVVAQLPENQPPVYRYAVLMEITGGTLRDTLDSDLAEVHSGSVVIDSADVGKIVVVEVGRQWQEGGLTIFESFAAWDVKLKKLRKSRGGIVELLVVFEPPGSANGVPGPIASGYTFTVLGRRDGSRLTLFMELVLPAVA